MSDFIPKWREGRFEELEHDIEYDISDIVLDVQTKNT